MRNLMILARWLAGRADVDVREYVGSTACIALEKGRRVIRIPKHWGYTADPEAQDLLEGVIDHEALGHGRFTDLEGRQKAEKQGLIKFTAFSSGLQNILEDVFIERCAIDAYSGVKRNFAKTVSILVRRGFFGTAEGFAQASKTQLLSGGLLNVLRYRLVPGQSDALEANVKALEPILLDVFGDLWEEILAIAMEVEHSTCTHDNILLTMRIMQVLESLAKQGPDSGDAASEPQEKKPGEELQAEPGEAGEGEAPPSCQVAESNPEGDLAKEAEAASEILEHLDDELEATEIGDVISQVIGKIAAKSERPVLMGESAAMGLISDESKRISSQLRNCSDELQEALLSRTYAEKSLGYAGKRLQGRALHRIAAGNSRVFVRKSEGEGLSTAVAILVDQSSSMDERLVDGVPRCEAVAGLAYGLADVISEFDVPLQISCYSNDFATYKRFDEDWTQLRRQGKFPRLNGSTYTGQAMERVLGDLVCQPQDRKILLVLTDGSTSDQERLMSCYSEAQAMGIEVASIMIGPNIPSIEKLASRFGFEAKSLNTSKGLGRYAVDRILAAI